MKRCSYGGTANKKMMMHKHMPGSNEWAEGAEKRERKMRNILFSLFLQHKPQKDVQFILFMNLI